VDDRIDRRQLLTLGAALLAGGSSVIRAAPQDTPPAIPVPDHWYKAQRIALWPVRPPGADGFKPSPSPADWPASYLRAVAMPEMHVYPARRPNGGAILAMPGGAYWFVSVVNEGADLAAPFNERGYTLFVLTYRLPGEGWVGRADVPLQDAQRAVRLIRAGAGEFGLDPARVTALGFSAGGHLAATLATRHAERVYTPIDSADGLDPRPQAAALIYPVISLQDPWTHALSRELLVGAQPTRAEIDRRSAELHVDAMTSPLFLVHAMDDTAVPVENSIRMMEAMRKARRPVEAHLLQEGGHAFGIGRPGTPSAEWINLMCAWLARVS
jgi:acetyl esterase/lipase